MLETRLEVGAAIEQTVSPCLDAYCYNREESPSSLDQGFSEEDAMVQTTPAAKRQKPDNSIADANVQKASEKERKKEERKAEKAVEKERQKAERAAERDAAKETARIAKASQSQSQKRENGLFALSEITLHIDNRFLESPGDPLMDDDTFIRIHAS